jgi:hypothetical protein
MVKILFFGDIQGKGGRRAVTKVLPVLKKKHRPDLIIANAENLAHGKGVTLSTIEEMIGAGIDFFTSGNHVFDKPEAKKVFEKYPDKIIRPANLENPELPGRGAASLTVAGQEVLIINLLGRVFMEKQFDLGRIRNPFLELNEVLSKTDSEVKIKLVDFHAEATSEKRGMGFWADGRVSAVLGTHTHVLSHDAQILPQGTGYLTDVGMTGIYESIIGIVPENALRRLVYFEDTGEKSPLEIAETGRLEISYCTLEIDEETGRCKNIEGEVLYS